MSRRAAATRVLHVASAGARGWAPARITALIARWGAAVTHDLAWAGAGAGAGAGADRAAALHAGGGALRRIGLPNLAGRPGPLRLQSLAEAMRGYDLVLTSGWDARNAVLAHSLFGPRMGLPPLVHHEDEEEVDGRGIVADASRMIALARAQALVVSSKRLARVARDRWRQPAEKVHQIAPGVAVAAFAARPRRDALPRVVKRPGERFVGTICPGTAGAGAPGAAPDLPSLVRALTRMPDHWHLVVLGDAADREQVLTEAAALAVGHRLHLPGVLPALARVIGLFDIFVAPASPGSSGDPLPTLGAMAAGLPVVGVRGGDAEELVAESNRRFLAAAGGDEPLAEALAALAGDAALRAAIGADNKAKARADHDLATILANLEAVYAGVLGRDRFL